MRSMVSYSKAAMERAMKVQEVILRAMAKKITWWQAAEIIGISDRSMRRWRERYEEGGYDGLFDRRKGKPSPKRLPVAVVEQVLGLYRDRYFDLNVRHFHEKLQSEHEIDLSYTWVKLALQGAGLVARGRKRGVHRKRRPRRPLAGDVAAHRRQPASLVPGRTLVRPDRDSGRRHQRDLLRAVGGRRIDADGDGGIEGSDRAPGRVLRTVQRSGEPFLADAEGGRESGSASIDASGTSVARTGDTDDSGLLAAGPGAQRAQFRHLARPVAAGVAAGGNHDTGGSECISARALRGRVQSAFCRAGGTTGQRVCGASPPRPGSRLRPAVSAR